MIAALTGMGLSAAAGLNAYIPFLIVALVAKFTDVITLPATYAWIESWWAIGIGSLLLLSEVVLDKIPAVDTVNDAVQTFIRPAMGGLIFAATAAAEEVDQSVVDGRATRGSASSSVSSCPGWCTPGRPRRGPS